MGNKIFLFLNWKKEILFFLVAKAFKPNYKDDLVNKIYEWSNYGENTICPAEHNIIIMNQKEILVEVFRYIF